MRKLRAEAKGAILCFVGPPGTGKTSLGQSIARALGRKFLRMSLGGIRDEAEIRGHRRTYVGALPGRIIQEIRRAGSNNPLIMLDEVDKLGMDFRGDPASALLEVLDPEQNFSFTDHYLDVPFDLSRIMFITTANLIDPVPAPLRDRMEVIELPGYTEHEKLQIAKRYLLPRQLKENGISPKLLKVSYKAILEVVRSYTREAGVRNIERELGAICRKVARQVAKGEKKPTRVTPANLADFLGPIRFRWELAEEAGYHAGRLVHINSYYTSKCICEEIAHLYIGTDLMPAEAPPDETEFLERRIFAFEEALRMTLGGEIMDSMSVIALLLAARRRQPEPLAGEGLGTGQSL